ncbi:MAG TPA: hypothetical protein VKV27_16225 [Solirubrobacteraceae bacterium]|nr:hypothetical protein [Solirubrobacteraceae bacterium]
MSALPVSDLLGAQPVEPRSIREGGRAAQSAWAEGVAFEDVLVSELSQQLTQTVPGLDGLDGQSGDGLGGQSADGLGGSDPASAQVLGGGAGLGAYASLLPQALTDAIMSAGGTGVAMQIARALDPALAGPASAGRAGVARPAAKAGIAGSPSGGAAP